MSDAVLLLAYGSPERLDQVEAYYTDIRRGSPPPPELLEELLDRYRAIGGGSPLSAIVERQRAALAAELATRGRAIPVYAAMRHIEPRIRDVLARLAGDGVGRLAVIALAPQASSMSSGAYRAAVERAAAALGGGAPEVRFVEGWADQPRLVAALAHNADAALDRFPEPASVRVLFTAHSLPERIVAAGDPYPEQVRLTASLVARGLGLPAAAWGVAYQSAGRTGEAWLGPELRAEIRRLAAVGARDLLVCPVGFVADHLEVLYDIDIEARAVADSLGVHLERSASLNDDPVFVTGLADLAIGTLGWPGALDPNDSLDARPAAPASSLL